MFKKMLKLTVISAVVIGAAGLFVFGDHAGSYFSTVSNSVRESVKDRIPVEFEIKRAEKLIRQIDPEINECKRDVALAEVELDHLVKQVAKLKQRIVDQERELKMGADHLTNAQNSSFESYGNSYSRRRVEMKLERTFESYKNNKAILKTKSALIERQTLAVNASRVKLDSVRARKAELENTIAALKVQKKHLDALAATNRRFDLDDSALSQATEVLEDVKKRLDVTQKMIEDDIFFADGVGTERAGKPRRDILKEISQHFGGDGDEAKAGLNPRGTSAEAPAVVLNNGR